MSAVCCVCQQKLSSENNKKNIFKDDLIIRNESEKAEGINYEERAMKLYSGIELITHQKIFETCGSPVYLCDPCFKKLEGFLNFREQVLSSFGIIFNGQSSFNLLKEKSLESQPGKSKLEDSQKTTIELDYLEEEISDSPKLPDRISAPEVLINVDESSISVDVDFVESEEIDTNNSLNCSRLQNDQDNNNLNESDSSSDHIEVQRCEDSPLRVQESDIESEIDVCSGDDDEILEMQAQRKENILEVETSSESEIEVCDYEPTGKRIKDLNSLSQALPF
ncbi:uncharacterized protein LOC117174884 [Belonocnema kinseyi]|uniref:uncharacterized protein LOC117174884 n=1 Tax=Belonocnema kinseyi TaxID=2817044 RepID=UPI00143CE1B6|nr:uncharacterized protein LOC117174884 [Belonocnema kinseyi]